MEMAPPEAVNDGPIGQHIVIPDLDVAEPVCPWCGQGLTRRQAREIRGRIEREERERIAKAEGELKARMAQLETQKKAEIAKAQKEAAQKADQQMKQLKATQEASIAKAKADAVAAEQAKQFAEKQRFQEKVQELERQLQKKTANELGEGAEIDLFTELKREFGGDQIVRIRKGIHGPDISHRIVHNGKTCGLILYESKNSSRWMNNYTTILNRHATVEKADYSILSTTVFPAGVPRQVYLRDGVIIANPARVVVLAQLLRRQIVQAYSLRLTTEGRKEKTAALYDFITSDQCARSFEEIEKFIADLMELESREKSQHQTVWKRRDELVRGIQSCKSTFWREVETIIGTTAPADVDAQL
jgi:hypothetical protein